jgi:hypothetical protein
VACLCESLSGALVVKIPGTGAAISSGNGNGIGRPAGAAGAGTWRREHGRAAASGEACGDELGALRRDAAAGRDHARAAAARGDVRAAAARGDARNAAIGDEKGEGLLLIEGVQLAGSGGGRNARQL